MGENNYWSKLCLMLLEDIDSVIEKYEYVFELNADLKKDIDDIKETVKAAINAGNTNEIFVNDTIKHIDEWSMRCEAESEFWSERIRQQWEQPREKNKEQKQQQAQEKTKIFTDNFAALEDNLRRLNKGAISKFNSRLKAIQDDFTLNSFSDASKFEQANNKMSKTKQKCETILKNSGVDGAAWEIKFNAGAAVRFAAIQDKTNKQWFILSDPYLHKDNKPGAEETPLMSAANTYCKNINNLEKIPEKIQGEDDYLDMDELDTITEQLEKLLEL